MLPDRRTREPGSIDRTQVGDVLAWQNGTVVPNELPFRIETTDGHAIERVPGWTWSVGAGPSAWGWAAPAAAGLALLAVALVLGVRRTTASAAPPRAT